MATAKARTNGARQPGNSPIHSVSLGLIHASIFENTVTRGDREVTMLSVTVQRRFQQNGEWKSSSSFAPSELPVLQRVVGRALEYIESLQADAEESE